jgi:regulator of sigma E protease
MYYLLGIIAFVVMLSLIVVVHEGGHFLVARHFGVYCHEFSIGMGPVIYQKPGKETKFSIRAIPFGGYVMMAGEEDGSQDEETEWLKNVPDERRLNHKPWWQQVLVMLAGIFMNMLLAWILFVGLAMARGYVVEDAIPQVYEFTENSAVQKAGLEKGDIIIEAESDGDVIQPKTQYDLLEYVQYHHDTITLTVQRDDQTFTVDVAPTYDEESQVYYLGFRAIAQAEEIKWYQGFGVGTKDWLDSGSVIFRSLSMLLKGKGYENLSGPVGILNVTSQTAQLGLGSYLSLCALISMNIGIFNALPIPALDGGRVLIVLIETITRHKFKQKIIETCITASFVLLMALFVFATYNDILRFF